ncbi:hypothetical protein J6590_058759 [Homalodisca vitripennis]|nr:hypothetical protein J6590_058759 [Homalodisca vitripennis]
MSGGQYSGPRSAPWNVSGAATQTVYTLQSVTDPARTDFTPTIRTLECEWSHRDCDCSGSCLQHFLTALNELFQLGT